MYVLNIYTKGQPGYRGSEIARTAFINILAGYEGVDFDRVTINGLFQSFTPSLLQGGLVARITHHSKAVMEALETVLYSFYERLELDSPQVD